jgi:hypothetical protein
VYLPDVRPRVPDSLKLTQALTQSSFKNEIYQICQIDILAAWGCRLMTHGKASVAFKRCVIVLRHRLRSISA